VAQSFKAQRSPSKRWKLLASSESFGPEKSFWGGLLIAAKKEWASATKKLI